MMYVKRVRIIGEVGAVIDGILRHLRLSPTCTRTVIDEYDRLVKFWKAWENAVLVT